VPEQANTLLVVGPNELSIRNYLNIIPPMIGSDESNSAFNNSGMNQMDPSDIQGTTAVSIRLLPAPTDIDEPITKEKDAFFSEQLDDLANCIDSFNWQNDVFQGIRQKLESPDPIARGEGCHQMKKLLSAGREEIINIAQSSLDEGLIPPVLAILESPDISIDDRLSAAFCITNVLAGTVEQTSAVVNLGGLKPLLNILKSEDGRLRRQAMFAIANVAGNTNQDRMMLAELPQYWENTINAIMTAPRKIEELGCWNLRNTCVLGGVPLYLMESAIKFFVQFLLNEVKQEEYGGGYSSLRFATETIATVCKTPEGRRLLLELDAVPVLCLTCTRFSMDNNVRGYCLESTWRLLEFPSEDEGLESDNEYNERLTKHISQMISSNMIYLLNAILKRNFTYCNVNRMYASRILMLMVLRSKDPEVSEKAARQMLLPSTRDMERSTLASQWASYWDNAPLSTNENNNSHVTGVGLELLKSKGIQGVPTMVNGSDDSSTLESLFKIIYNLDAVHEHWTREAAGRTVIAIILKAPADISPYLFNRSVLQCICDVMETAHVTETWMKEKEVLKEEGIITEDEGQDDTSKSEKTKEQKEEDALLQIRQLTYPEGHGLAIRAISQLKKHLPDGLRETLSDAVLNDPEIRALERLRRVVFNSSSCIDNKEIFLLDYL